MCGIYAILRTEGSAKDNNKGSMSEGMVLSRPTGQTPEVQTEVDVQSSCSARNLKKANVPVDRELSVSSVHAGVIESTRLCQRPACG